MYFSGTIELPENVQVPDKWAGWITRVPTASIFCADGKFEQYYLMIEASEEFCDIDTLLEFVRKIGRELKANRIFGRIDRDSNHEQVLFD